MILDPSDWVYENVTFLILKFNPDDDKMIGMEENMALFTDFLRSQVIAVLVAQPLNHSGMIITPAWKAPAPQSRVWRNQRGGQKTTEAGYFEALAGLWGHEPHACGPGSPPSLWEEAEHPGHREGGAGESGGAPEGQRLLPMLCVVALNPANQGWVHRSTPAHCLPAGQAKLQSGLRH